MIKRAIKLPDVGEGVTEAELVEWHVEVGDLVREDDILAEVMTDKATVEIPSLYDGTIVERAGDIGAVLPIGTDLVWIETEADGPQDLEPDAAPHQDVQPVLPAIKPSSAVPHETVLASPFVRARARQAGIDLGDVPGTGPAGRVTEGDLDAFMSPQPNVPALPKPVYMQGDTQIKVAGLRRRIADRMALANARIPHITVVEEVDVTALEDLRADLNSSRGERPKMTMLPLICAALSSALVDHPEMNAHFDDEAGVIHRHAAIHLGIATMTEKGLMVPVIRDAQARKPFETAREILRLSEAARTGDITRDDLTGSTFTVTSLGPLGAVATTPIINPPEVAILGINKMDIRPHWDGSQFVPRKKMNLSASFDHRVIDGWDAAVFVQKVKSLLEAPLLTLVGP